MGLGGSGVGPGGSSGSGWVRVGLVVPGGSRWFQVGPGGSGVGPGWFRLGVIPPSQGANFN